MSPQKLFGLVDCNSFYASCERLFNPKLSKSPVVVLSNNDGCAIARTKEAKDLGIKMGDPYFKIKNFCEKNNVAIFSSNFALYTNISNRVMSTLEKESPRIQVYSIDEAFIDLTGVSNPQQFGIDIQSKVLQNIGIPVSVGIAPTKVLSKIANNLAKRSTKSNGVVVLTSEKLQDIALQRTSVADIWGIGNASAAKLNSLGIKTAYDFKVFKNEKLIQNLLTKVGLQIKHELMGINCFSLEGDVNTKKEIMCSRTFGKSVFDLDILKKSIANYTTEAAEKLRRQKSMCTEISVFALTNGFKNIPQYYMYNKTKLINPTNDTRKLIKSIFTMLDVSYRSGFEYNKAGVKLSGFYSSEEYQVDFLSDVDTIKDIRLMQTIDLINFKEGSGTVKLGACGTENIAWKMKQEFKSPRYTTSWFELPVFK